MDVQFAIRESPIRRLLDRTLALENHCCLSSGMGVGLTPEEQALAHVEQLFFEARKVNGNSF